jgi:hypothetical protein
VNATSDAERIAGLLATATSEAAAELRDIAETTDNRETRKLARKALYTLSQKHITPPEPDLPATPEPSLPAAPVHIPAYASNIDGAGNRAVYLFYPDPDGGSPTFVQFLTNDAEGIRDLGVRRVLRREAADLAQNLFNRMESGIVMAEVGIDYAVHLVHEARAINQRLRTQTPPGVAEWLARLPAPAGDYTTPPIYSHLSEQEMQSDPNAPYDPHELFLLRWFEPWFLAVEDVIPWLDHLLTASPADESEEVRRAEAERATAEAVDALFDDQTRRRYIYRLEETADILWRRGLEPDARQALYHAIDLKSDRPAREIPFAQRLVERTITVALTMQMQEE